MATEEINDSGESVEREPKWAALRRLKALGLEGEFQKRKAHYRHREGGRLSIDDAFYTALAEFPSADEMA